MKKIMLIIILGFSTQAKAMEGFALGIMMGSLLSSDEEVITKEIPQDSFSLVVKETYNQMDRAIDKGDPTVTINYKGFNVDKISSYFKMKDFQIIQKETSLMFNLTPFLVKNINKKNDMQYEKEDLNRQMFSLGFWLVLGFLILCILVMSNSEGISEGTFLMVFLIYNLGWFLGSGNIFLISKPKPVPIDSLSVEYNQKLPKIWHIPQNNM